MFKKSNAGFDSLIGLGMLVKGQLSLTKNTTTVIDGEALLNHIDVVGKDVDDNDKKELTTLVINGQVASLAAHEASTLLVEVKNVTVSGMLECKVLKVPGLLVVKAGGKIKARSIYYRDIIIEAGGAILGSMEHLDHLPIEKETCI